MSTKKYYHPHCLSNFVCLLPRDEHRDRLANFFHVLCLLNYFHRNATDQLSGSLDTVVLEIPLLARASY